MIHFNMIMHDLFWAALMIAILKGYVTVLRARAAMNDEVTPPPPGDTQNGDRAPVDWKAVGAIPQSRCTWPTFSVEGADLLTIPVSSIVEAIRTGNVSISAKLSGSVARPFGDAHEVKVSVACGEFLIAIVDEVRVSIEDFHVAQAELSYSHRVSTRPDDLAELAAIGITAPIADEGELDASQTRDLAKAIAGLFVPDIRWALSRLFPGSMRLRRPGGRSVLVVDSSSQG